MQGQLRLDEGGPNNCLVRYMSHADRGSDLFICSHGGWDGQSLTVTDKPIYFYGAHNKIILPEECYQIMRDYRPDKATSICGGGEVWNYSIGEFEGDWSGAIDSVNHAYQQNQLRYDCCMVNDLERKGRAVRISDVQTAFPGYYRYHYLACRVLPRSQSS